MPTTPLLTAAGCTLHDAGRDWDVIRVPHSIGRAAIGILGTRCGAVLEDPRQAVVYYFVPCGTAEDWAVHGTQALSEGTTLAIPPARCTQPPGPHWRVCPGDSNWHTDARALRAALEDCVLSAGGSERPV